MTGQQREGVDAGYGLLMDTRGIPRPQKDRHATRLPRTVPHHLHMSEALMRSGGMSSHTDVELLQETCRNVRVPPSLHVSTDQRLPNAYLDLMHRSMSLNGQEDSHGRLDSCGRCAGTE